MIVTMAKANSLMENQVTLTLVNTKTISQLGKANTPAQPPEKFTTDSGSMAKDTATAR